MTAVYRYFAADGSLLYVGITGRRRQRQSEHAAEAVWWHLAARCEIEHMPTLAAALLRERELIRELKPRFNRTLARTTKAERLKAAQAALRAQNYDPNGAREAAELSAAGRHLARLAARSRKQRLADAAAGQVPR